MRMKNFVLIGLTVLVILLIIWRHKTCPTCQQKAAAVKDAIFG